MSGNNLSHSMRANYSTYGVENVALIHNDGGDANARKVRDGILLFFLPNRGPHGCISQCSGEVTEALGDWIRTAYHCSKSPPKLVTPNRPESTRDWKQSPPPLSPANLRIDMYPTDPYTAPAYEQRVQHACATLSFQDIAIGELPKPHFTLGVMESEPHDTNSSNTLGDQALHPTNDEINPPKSDDDANLDEEEHPFFEMTVCSFALHLVETPSQLYSLLTELSRKSRWLIVIAPHKKPE
ncbi:hypothetical protein FRC17_006090, partial [Serendipita sp. 399]